MVLLRMRGKRDADVMIEFFVSSLLFVLVYTPECSSYITFILLPF